MLRKNPPTGVQPGDAGYADAVADAVFLSDRLNTCHYSMYQVTTTDEFRRAVMALLSGRQSDTRFTENISFVCVTDRELKTAGPAPVHQLGDSACTRANQLHFEWPADENQARALAAILATRDVPEVTLRKRHLKPWLEHTMLEQCRIVQLEAICTDTHCA